MKINSLFKLATFSLMVVLFSCERKPTEKIQDVLSQLQKGPFSNLGIETSMKDLGVEKWSVIEQVTSYNCYGDVCYKTVYGLVNNETGDTLAPAFNDIVHFGGKLVLIQDRWTAVTDHDLNVERALLQVVVANDSLMLVSNGQTMGALNAQFQEVMPMTYDSIVAMEVGFLLQPTYVLKVKEGGKWGVMSGKREQMIAPLYDAIYPLMGYAFAAKREGKFGMIAWDGAELAEFKYDSMYSGGVNHAIVVNKKKLGLISMEGKELTQQIYESLSGPSLYGCRCARRDGRYGVVSGNGEEISEFIYDDYKRYAVVYDAMQFKKHGRWGFYDCRTQKEITPFTYDDVTAFFGDEANVMVNGKLKLIRLR